MSRGTRLFVAFTAAALISVPAIPTAVSQSGGSARPDFDIREGRPAVAPRVTPEQRLPQDAGTRPLRFNRESGTVRVLDEPALAAAPRSGAGALRALLVSNARRLGLEPIDLSTLTLIRDYTSRSNGVRHVVFSQIVDTHPVFDSSIALHLARDGSVLRITSNAAPIDGRDATVGLSANAARVEAASHTGGGDAGPASLTWLTVDGRLRLAWHVAVAARTESDLYDVLVDAQTAELLIRRNRVRRAEGSGRVLQSAAPDDPRRPDPMPLGGDGSACPPPANYATRSLNSQFRDPATVLGASGRLSGNNTAISRGSATVPSASGTFDGASWLFDFPFNSAGSAETFLFFAVNFAHDFFYDLGFDEGAGNFQVDNFGRGGVGGDPLKVNARAPGRNNANYVHAVDGGSPTINMFLWDGTGCWAEDVNADGVPDIDGDYDFDILIHEYHHGVSLRLNTAFTGNEASAIGEGGGDFFAYSVNGGTVLAEYARPGGLRQVNDRDYGDWTCLLGFICEEHDNGEIWANALWDVRERLRTDLAGGSEAAAVNESHQLYIDALTLSPPSPTMLDMRDAMLQADSLRNGGTPASQNFCRLWESFAGRGMGVSATDTADNGFNVVGAAYDVPAGCQAPPVPPPPPMVSVATGTGTATEAGLVAGSVVFSRAAASDAPLTISYIAGGSAAPGTDYVALPGSVTIGPGALSATVPVVPLDDALVESNETVLLSILATADYTIGSPSSAVVTIVSDDVAPDLVVTALTATRAAPAGGTLDVGDTTKNQGAGAAVPSTTSFYLSRNAVLDAADPLLGSRDVGTLTPGATSIWTLPLALPATLEAGTYYLFAKADGPNAVTESNELNNTRSVTVAVGPDLVVTALSAPLVAAAGTSIVVSDTTANQGAGSSPTSGTRFFLSKDVFVDATDVALDARTVPALDPGVTSSGPTTLAIPAGTLTGTYYLFAKADAAGLVGESSETNNTRSVTIKIGPDLTVAALTAPARAAAGGTIAVSDTTRNVGAGPSLVTTTTAFFLSTNFMLDAADIRLPSVRLVSPLAAGESSTGPTSLTLPSIAPGTWFLIASADDGNAVTETLETNNTRYAIVQVGPDLNFSAVTSPSSGVAGTTISVTATVRNSGGAPAGASVVHFYLSSNSTFDASDQRLEAVRDVPALAVDASHTSTTSVPLPAGRSGTFYLLIVADALHAVAEYSEGNNVAARLIQIAPGS